MHPEALRSAVRHRVRPKPNGVGNGSRRILSWMPPEKPCPAGQRKGVRMMPDNVALFATIILLLPMFYFLLAAPAFLLVRLDVPTVAQLLRGMFSGYFLTLAIAGAIGTVAVAVTGRMVLALGIALIAAFSAWSRRWFLRQMDARLRDRDAG